jgi:hypothetical protein
MSRFTPGPATRSAAVVAVLLASLIASLSTAPAALPATSAAAIPRGRVAIGDSVMLGAAEELRARGFRRVDAVVSRQFSSADNVLRSYRRSGRLARNVIIGLGTNGTVTLSQCHRAVAAAPHRAVFLVNNRVPRSWQARNNRVLGACAGDFGRVRLINWYRKSSGHPGWIASDGYHLTSVGQNRYARYIDSRVDRVT